MGQIFTCYNNKLTEDLDKKEDYVYISYSDQNTEKHIVNYQYSAFSGPFLITL
jgi:hypothetical protein